MAAEVELSSPRAESPISDTAALVPRDKTELDRVEAETEARQTTESPVSLVPQKSARCCSRCIRWCCCSPVQQFVLVSLLVVLCSIVAWLIYAVAMLRLLDGGVEVGEFFIPDVCATSLSVPLSFWLSNPSPLTVFVRDLSAFLSPTAYSNSLPVNLAFADTAPVSISLPAHSHIDITPGLHVFNTSLLIAINEPRLFDALRFLKAHSSVDNYGGLSVAVFAAVSVRVFGWTFDLTSAQAPLVVQDIDFKRLIEDHTTKSHNRTKPRAAMEIVAQRVEVEFGSEHTPTPASNSTQEGIGAGSVLATLVADADLRAVLSVSRFANCCFVCSHWFCLQLVKSAINITKAACYRVSFHRS